MTPTRPDLIVLHEHPEWQKPLFGALERRGVSFAPLDLTRAAFSNEARPQPSLYFNQASPSAYLRGHARAVPFALALMRTLALQGARVLIVLSHHRRRIVHLRYSTTSRTRTSVISSA